MRIVKDLDSDLTDRHVLVVEDIVDSGLTLSYLRRSLLARRPASLEVCALLVKEGRQRAKLDLRYIGFQHPPRLRRGLWARRGRAVPQRARHPRLPGADPRRLNGPNRDRRPRPVERLDRPSCSRPSARIPGARACRPRPRRVAAMYEELFAGIDDDPERHLTVTFAAEHDEMVMVRDIPFASLCEHHLVPVHGEGPRRLHPRRGRPRSPGCRSSPVWSTSTPGVSRSRSG